MRLRGCTIVVEGLAVPTITRVAAPCAVATLALLVASASATAAPKRITGKLSKRSYTVIAVAADGEGKTVRANPRFKLRPPARRVSLQLWGRDGFYAGPVVVEKRKHGRVAILGVKAGAKLGRVKVNKRKGYATARPARKWIDPSRKARARRGVPIGARNFGLVRAKVPRRSPPGDRDRDGVTDLLDIDANGNLLIDQYEGREAIATASRAELTFYLRVLAVNGDGTYSVEDDCGTEGVVPPTVAGWSPTPIVGKVYEVTIDFGGYDDYEYLSIEGPIAGGCPASALVPRPSAGLSLTLRNTLNAHAYAGGPAAFKGLVDETQRDRGILFFRGGTTRKATVELDCPGAPFCAAGGTGRFTGIGVRGGAPSSWPDFPECCDADGDGFGEVSSGFLSHGATADEIGVGTALDWRITLNGKLHEFPTSLAGVFATIPALVSYEDGAGNRRDVSYPIPPPYAGSPNDFFGSSPGPFQGFPVAPCPSNGPPPCVDPGDAVVTFTYYRPQRESLTQAGEPGAWIDIRDLVYAITLWKNSQYGNIFRTCELGEMLTTDKNLTPTPAGAVAIYGDADGFLDSGDQVDRDNVLSFSVNLTKCWGRGSDAVAPGDDVVVWLAGGVRGADGSAGATQQLLFTLD